jgi:hypothetical protein
VLKKAAVEPRQDAALQKILRTARVVHLIQVNFLGQTDSASIFAAKMQRWARPAAADLRNRQQVR